MLLATRSCTLLKILTALLLTFTTHAIAEDKGLTIAKEQKKRDLGWQDSIGEMTMILRSANGRENTRSIDVKSLEVQAEGSGDKSLMVFNEPKDVAGTAFLTYSHINKPDDQWIFLPALKRVKRIASNKKTGSFMGSEFSYEDLSSFEVEKYTFTYLRDEPCPVSKGTCFVVQSVPNDKFSGYTQLISWINHDEYLTEKVEFYDKKKTLLKVLTNQKHEKINNQFWRPIQSIMENKRSGRATVLLWENIQLKTGLTEQDFSQNNLKRAK